MIDQFEFLFFFLPALMFVFDRFAAPRRRMWLLVVASLAFYAVASLAHVPFLIGSIAVNFAIGRRLSERRDLRLLWAGVAADLVPLVWWKIALPAGAPPGLSYFTFAQ